MLSALHPTHHTTYPPDISDTLIHHGYHRHSHILLTSSTLTPYPPDIIATLSVTPAISDTHSIPPRHHRHSLCNPSHQRHTLHTPQTSATLCVSRCPGLQRYRLPDGITTSLHIHPGYHLTLSYTPDISDTVRVSMSGVTDIPSSRRHYYSLHILPGYHRHSLIYPRHHRHGVSRYPGLQRYRLPDGITTSLSTRKKPRISF